MKKTIMMISILIVSGFANSQSIKLNVDSIFGCAIAQAKSGNYNNSIKESRKALAGDTTRADIVVYMANVYSWKDKNDSALTCIQQARARNYAGNDLYESWTNILFRQHKYTELLSACDEAEKKGYSQKEDLLQKRLIAYSNLSEYSKGILTAEEPANAAIIKNEPVNTIYNSLLLKKSKEMVTLSYTNESFDSIASQHIASIGYYSKLGEHTLGISLNYANRFAKKDVQLESDFYLQMINEQYLHFNYAYALNAYLFPQNRIGMEYYFPITKKTSASLGLRYMHYSAISNPNLYIITGHLEKHFKKSSLSIRPYYVIKRDQQSLSFITNFKHFGKSDRNFWGIAYGFGNSPDDIYTTQQTGGFNQLKAHIYKIEKSFIVTRLSDLHLQLGYTSEQYNPLRPDKYRNRYIVELGYKIHFR
jgi:YaiO family outer membrane protein